MEAETSWVLAVLPGNCFSALYQNIVHIRLSDSEGKQGLLEIEKITIKKLLDAVSGETDLGVITVRQNSLRIIFFQESF